MTSKHDLVQADPWLKPFQPIINFRSDYIAQKSATILDGQQIEDFSKGYGYFGLHQGVDSWVLREWAPNATKLVLVGEFTDWQELNDFVFTKLDGGKWSLEVPLSHIKHGNKYKLKVYWPGGEGYRIPSYTTRVVQDGLNLDFNAEVWQPLKPYVWRNDSPKPPEVPLIYEAHVGMSSEQPRVASFKEFTRDVLPRIKAAGYNTIQLMAVQEHPYYGSFGYHVSNFFAISSRFGTPDDLRKLVDAAHGLGVRVIIDIVHSHAVKNELEGLSRFDGTLNQYFKGDHPAWDSRIFDYGKPEVVHFLLSNLSYFLNEFRVDGFRFDGVTSMIYYDHGLGKAFSGYQDYFDDVVDKDALMYLQLANRLIHKINPAALTIAEDMSGYPGLCLNPDEGGIGFDYRLGMGAPDLWIRTLKEQRDEDWNLGEIVHTLHSRRPEEKVISYAESHDQALVGDKTLIFRLIDKDMYDHMSLSDSNSIVERGIALHKMIRLLTAALHGGGYLNFMGNEFGHPEWIDFPREGNNWSYLYARRQWSLADNKTLKYQWLNGFDRQIIMLARLLKSEPSYLKVDQARLLISFVRNNYLFIYNFSPSVSLVNHEIEVPAGSYRVVLNSDDSLYGGQNLVDRYSIYFSSQRSGLNFIKVYIPARSALVLTKKD